MRLAYGGSYGVCRSGDAGQRRAVALGQPPAALQDLVEHLQLAEAERGLHVGHADVEAALGIALEDDVAGAVAREVRDVHRVRAQPPQALGDRRVVRRAIMPPSPVVITLRGCSEKQASGPSEPIGRPL